MLRALALVFALGSGMVLAAGSSAGAVESTPILVVTGAESYEAGSDACFTVTIDGAALSGDALLEIDQADPVDVQFLSIVDGMGTACFSSLGQGDFEAWAMWLGESAYVEASGRVQFFVVGGGSSQVRGSLSIAPTASAFAAGEAICFDTYGTDAAVGQGAMLSVRAREGADTDATVHTDAVAPAFNPQSLCIGPTLAPGDYVASFALDDQTIVAEPAFFAVTAPASSAVSATPQMALVPSSVAWIVGAGEHLAVAVSGAGETPTGRLTLSAIDGVSSDASPVADAQLSGGTADFDLSAVPAGTSALVVTYAGDAGYSPIQASVSVTVTAPASSSEQVRVEPMIALTPQEVQASTSVPVTISVAGPGDSDTVPTGDITVHYGEGDADRTTLALSDAGTATVELQFNFVGTTTLRVDYAGDGNFAPTSQSFQVLVNAPPASDISSAPSSAEASSASSSAPLIVSQLSVYADPESAAVGGLVDLIGHLQTEGDAPTGTITFYEGDTAIASISALNAIASGLFEARVQAQFLTVGEHSIRAAYLGDTTHAPAEATFQFIVVPAPVSSVSSVTELPVLVVSGEQSVAAGADACFTVTASSGGPSGDALLEVTDGQEEQTTVAFALQSGAGSVCVSGLAAGNYSAVAMSTSEQLAVQTSGPFMFTVEAASSSVVLQTPQMNLAPTSIAWNAGAAESLSLSVHGSGSTPTGRVTLHAIAGTTGDDTTIGDATLSNGFADFDLSTVPAGTTTLVVEYAGDATYSAERTSVNVTVSTPAPSSEMVLPTPTISLLPTQAIRNAVTQVTVAITAPEGVESIPSGQIDVAFGEDDMPLPTLTLGGNGAVTQLLRFTVVGSTTVKIAYRGDLNFAPATASFDVSVIDPASDASSAPSASEPSSSSAVSAPLLTSDFTAMSATEPVALDTPVDLIGRIPFSGEAPTGNVTFFEDNTQVALGGLTGLPNAGLAEWRANASFATAGAHNILAVYSGDERYAPAQ